MADSVNLGKLQAALASATNEVTVAAANINFDFTLVKCEAPAEYQPLAQHLSTSRKHNAEHGTLHITARRLGALFEGLCPHTPNLLKAYGIRASEISNAVSAKNQHGASNWIFSEYTGVDVTSLWAAATSSKAALPVHLLACILARMWSDVEATSLWAELVSERRRDITARLERGETLPFSVMAAAVQQDITRDQLAEWDASARSWLKTADGVKALQQKQLLLIIKNISMPVNAGNSPYNSIVAAWLSSLETMEHIISGAPHAVKDGSVLVALSAWHIYADLVVFGGLAHNKTIEMQDSLVSRGGVISLGISDSGDRASRGIYWSLSLAHHKFYGRPVSKSSQLNGDGSRLTFLELQQAILGAILATWKVPVHETDIALKFLLDLTTSLPYNHLSNHDRWMEMLVVPIKQYFQDPEASASLVSLGMRRKNVIGPRKNTHERPFFGLTHLPQLLDLNPTLDNKIELLRRLSRRVKGLEGTQTIIAYREDEYWHLASVFPIRFRGRRPVFRTGSGLSSTRASHKALTHCRWIMPPQLKLYDSHAERIVSLPKKGYAHSRTLLQIPNVSESFEFLFGDADIAAVFVSQQDLSSVSIHRFEPPSVLLNDVLWCIQHDMIALEKLKTCIYSIEDSVIITLAKLSTAWRTFAQLEGEGASISPRVLTAPFGPAKETVIVNHDRSGESYPSYFGYLYTAESVVASIAYLELGVDIIGAKALGNILGISVGDSIYIPKKLIDDPGVHHANTEYTRLLGNIGKPGLSLLTCPKISEIRDIDLTSWRQVPVNFDGSQEDTFALTSLHLSFTHWKDTLWENDSVGQRESEGSYIEAVVSVRDSGCWVADVNPVAALAHPNVQYFTQPKTICVHENPWPLQHPMKVLETWEQVLDCPEGILVTKCHNNWVARLALVAVMAEHCQRSFRRIVICPPNICWQCVDIDWTKNTVYIY